MQAPDKRVHVSGILTGADVGNYLVLANTVTQASIAKALIQVTTSAFSKVYDGTDVANTGIAATGILGSDDIHFSRAGGVFADRNAR